MSYYISFLAPGGAAVRLVVRYEDLGSVLRSLCNTVGIIEVAVELRST